MKLKDILKMPKGSTVIWLWQRESDKITNATTASRRVHTYLTYPTNEGVKVSTTSVMVVDSASGTAEPATMITVL